MSKKSAKLTVVSIISLFVLIPISLFLILKFSNGSNYYLSAVLMIILSIVPFFAYFEKRKIKTSEIVIVAMMVALAVAARSVMAFIPQVKPTCALVAVTGIAFGANVGFVTGALAMFISNFLFGQGIFTPFQMLGMGLVGFFCGVIFYRKKYSTNRIVVSLVGGALCFAVYGVTVDLCSVITMVTEFTPKAVLSIFASGVPFNLIHGITTAIFLFFINKPMTDKFTRLRVKYGIFDME